jgi:hypothetical protein
MSTENKLKYLIVGSGDTAKELLAKHGYDADDVILVDSDNLKKPDSMSLGDLKKEFIPYSAPYTGEKEWKCKGKHQYRETLDESDGNPKVKWVCQCGAKL